MFEERLCYVIEALKMLYHSNRKNYPQFNSLQDHVLDILARNLINMSQADRSGTRVKFIPFFFQNNKITTELDRRDLKNRAAMKR